MSSEALQLVPKEETGALRFLAEHPHADGRNVTVAIFDTGVDPGAAHLKLTSDGRRKIIDLVDTTGSGDVDTSTVTTAVVQAAPPSGEGEGEGEGEDEGGVADGGDVVITGLTGRTLTIPSTWSNPTGQYHIGVKAIFELFPGPLVSRLKAERKKKWAITHRERVSDARQRLAEHTAASAEDKETTADLEAQLALLKDMETKFYFDEGPVYDCVVFHDGTVWRAAVDTSEKGDLSTATLMADYKHEQEYATLTDADQMNYSLKIYNDGNVLSIVTTSGSHGTHVAGITGAFDKDKPERNGVAPGCQIVSVKIGDSRLASMETGTGLVRGLIAALENKCDLINLSFGEATTIPDVGRFVKLAAEVVEKHNVIFLASAGNSGPALSSVGCPGGTTSAILGIGAYCTSNMMPALYSMREQVTETQFTWSSRGPTLDGDLGVSITAPGGAITDVPTWTLKAGQLMNGTSMSSPNACGGVALVLSALKEKSASYTSASVRRALENTAAVPTFVAGQGMLDFGHGMLQVDKALDYALANEHCPEKDVIFRVNVSYLCRKGRGIYLRDPSDFLQPELDATVSVSPVFHEDHPNGSKIKFDVTFALSCDADWIALPAHFVLMNETRSFGIHINTTELPSGLHTTMIHAMAQDGPSRGAIFEVPVTVVKPQEVDPSLWNIKFDRVSLADSNIERRFVACPEGATHVELKLTTHDFEGTRIIAIRLVQLERQRSHKFCHHGQYARLSGNQTFKMTKPVSGGLTVEFDIAKYCLNIGNSEVSAEIQFHGIRTNPVEFDSTANAYRMELASPLSKVVVKPSAKLELWHTSVSPSGDLNLKPLAGDQNKLPGGRRIYELILTYKFTQASKLDVRFAVPTLSDVLYESVFESQLWMLFDCNKKLLKMGDAFPANYSRISLDRGDYVVRLSVRHDDASKLEDLKMTPLVLERKLKDTITVDTYSRATNVGGTKLKEVSIERGGRGVVHLSGPKLESLPAGVKRGDVLVGQVKLVDKEDHPQVPMRYHISCTKGDPAGGASGSTSKQAATLDEALRDMNISWLAKHPKAAYEEHYKALCADFPKHLPLREANLRCVLSATKDDTGVDAAARVVGAADEVLALIDVTAVATHFGTNLNPLDTAAKDERAEMTDLKKLLVNALSKKATALLSLARDEAPESDWVLPFEAPKQAAAESAAAPEPAAEGAQGTEEGTPEADTAPVKSKAAELKDCMAELCKWADPATDADLMDLYVKYQCGMGHVATALKCLAKFWGGADAKAKTRVLLTTFQQLIKHLGWDHCLHPDQELLNYPKAYPLF